ncbi:hypothetical protein ACFDR9_003708 [Janthinobacterium sp. CG_23.3]|nr:MULTISPECIES: hypothetical protein [unclassified Janthinobacterium]MEC5162745.1 hypothetical protein [Janthinobacterium sp. CG_S6]
MGFMLRRRIYSPEIGAGAAENAVEGARRLYNLGLPITTSQKPCQLN